MQTWSSFFQHQNYPSEWGETWITNGNYELYCAFCLNEHCDAFDLKFAFETLCFMNLALHNSLYTFFQAPISHDDLDITWIFTYVHTSYSLTPFISFLAFFPLNSTHSLSFNVLNNISTIVHYANHHNPTAPSVYAPLSQLNGNQLKEWNGKKLTLKLILKNFKRKQKNVIEGKQR